MSQVYFARHSGGLSMFFQGKPQVVGNDHPNFPSILHALSEKKFDDVAKLMNITDTLNRNGISRKLKDRKVFVKKGKVYYTDSHGRVKELAGALVDRIMTNLGNRAAKSYGDSLLAFMDNIQKNKLKDIREELYQWLMSGKTPITYDGCFLAYKKVRQDFKDIFSGSLDNSPGKVVRMSQDQVDPDRTNECSVGLHFCSLGYLGHYSGSNARIVVVKVNPRHVYAIPTDYSFQKGRASEYYVVGEVNEKLEAGSVKDQFNDSFIDEDTKAAVAPNVKFIGSLRPSLEAIGRSYGIVVDGYSAGSVNIVTRRGRMVPVRTDAQGNCTDIIGTPITLASGEVPVPMSLATTSVRKAVKAAVQKAEKSTKI